MSANIYTARRFASAGGIFIALVAAFCVGKWYERRFGISSFDAAVAAAPVVTPVDDPARRLQLDNLCAQSAAAYAHEHEDHLAVSNEYEHGYNPRLEKCLVILKATDSIGRGALLVTESIHDTADGKSFGDYRYFAGPKAGGGFQEDVQVCGVWVSAKMFHVCKSKQEWVLNSSLLLHE
jgi:hypothetical protein